MVVDTVVLAGRLADTDRADALAAAAADVAGPAMATVHLLHVFSTDQFEHTLEDLGYDPENPPDPDEVAERVVAIRTIADRLNAPHRPYGTPYEVHGRVSDDPGGAIVDFAIEVGADRVFVGGRSRSPVGKALIGSTAQHVLLTAPCPVTFVRTE